MRTQYKGNFSLGSSTQSRFCFCWFLLIAVRFPEFLLFMLFEVIFFLTGFESNLKRAICFRANSRYVSRDASRLRSIQGKGGCPS